jgi:anti-sigma factor RsiW
MAECSTELVRDRLPDLLHGRLSASERLVVEGHLAACEECAAELALLAELRREMDAPELVDVGAVGSEVLGRVGAPDRATGGGRATSHRPAGGSLFSLVALRAAAAVILFAGGAYAVGVIGGRGTEDKGVATTAGSRDGSTGVLEVASAEISAELSLVGTTESEIEALARRIDAFDGLHSEAPAPVVALVDTPEAW